MKKFSLLIAASVFSTLGACGFNQAPTVQQPASIPVVQQPVVNQVKVPANTVVSVVDLKGTLNGRPTGATLSLTLNTPANGFATKGSSDGQVQGLVSNIRSYTLFLTSSNTNPSNSANMAGGAGSIFTVDRDGSATSSHTVLFNNVPVGSWYAAVSAWDATSGGGNNITKEASYDEGILKLGISTDSVTVNSDLTITDPGETLQVNLQLQDEVGAIIGTTINPIDGTTAGTYSAS